MRVKPSVGVAAAIAVGYTVLFIGLLLAFDVDMSDPFADVDSARSVATVLGISAVVMALVTTVLGWWGPVMREDLRIGGWMRFVPVIVLVAVLAAIDYSTVFDLDSDMLLWTAAAALLVGFTEELVYRGLALVGFRGGLSEMGAWFWATIAFSLLHLPNIVAGADVGPTIFQLFAAVAGGTVFYIARRATGTIVMAMVLHMLWDFGSFSADEYLLNSIPTYLAFVILIAFLIQRKKVFGDASAVPQEA